MAIIPDDELCIQQMLGILEIPKEIEQEYMIRARMLHRQLAGGPIGPVAIVDMLRFLGFALPPPQFVNQDGMVDWRRVEVGTRVEVKVDGTWQSGDQISFAGEVGGGTVAVEIRGRIDEFNGFDVRIPDPTLPSDVDAESFEGEAERDEGDARVKLIEPDDPENEAEVIENTKEGATDTKSDQNEVENGAPKGDIGSDDDIPPNTVQKVNWGKVKKNTEVWLREGDDLFDAKFQRCEKPDKALVHVEGEKEPRLVDRAFLKLPD